MSLTQKLVSGAFWTWMSRVSYYGITLISASVLARILPPSDYGLMGMVVVFTGFLALFRDLGGGAAVVREREPSQEFLSTVFWANVGVAFLMAIMAAACAPLVAQFYSEPRVQPIMTVLSATFLISGAAVVPNALLMKRMNFRALSIIEVVSSAFSTATAITLALLGFGVWSLVGASIALSVATTLFVVGAARWAPKLTFRVAELAPIVGFSLNLSGFNVVNYAIRNGDKLLIGRLLGPAALGYYQFAYTLMLFPLQNITFALGNVLFAAFASIRDDDARFRQGYIRSTRLIGLVTFPLMLGMMATAGPLITTIIGDKWAPVIPLIVILAPVGLVQSITSTVGQIYLAKGRTDIQLRWTIFSALVTLPAMVYGMQWGIAGLAAMYSAVTLLLAYPLLHFGLRLVKLRVKDFLIELWPCFWPAVLMSFVVWWLRFSLESTGAPSWVVLSIAVALGGAIYFGLLALTKATALVEVLQLVSSFRYGKAVSETIMRRCGLSASPAVRATVS